MVCAETETRETETRAGISSCGTACDDVTFDTKYYLKNPVVQPRVTRDEMRQMHESDHFADIRHPNHKAEPHTNAPAPAIWVGVLPKKCPATVRVHSVLQQLLLPSATSTAIGYPIAANWGVLLVAWKCCAIPAAILGGGNTLQKQPCGKCLLSVPPRK